MMTWEDVQSLIQQGEGERLQFKEEQLRPGDFAKTFVAFANTHGGIVLVGVNRRGGVTGVRDFEALELRLRDVALHNCRPPIHIGIERVTSPEGDVLIVHAPEGPEKPYQADNGVYYVREGSRSRAALPSELTAMLYQARRFAVDRAPVPGARFEHLDVAKVEQYISRQRRPPRLQANDRSPQVFLSAVGLLDREFVPTSAALLLFGEYPQQFLPQAAVNAVRFRGQKVDNRQIVDSALIEGTIDEQIEESIQFVLRHSRTAARIEGVYREDVPEYPEAAIREVITNAVVHRDYLDNRRIALRMFDDRLEVTNPGALLGGLTIEDLLAGAQPHRRNLLLFGAARNLGLVEEQAGGILLVIRTMEENGSPNPVFDSDLRTNTFSVTLPSRWQIVEGWEEHEE